MPLEGTAKAQFEKRVDVKMSSSRPENVFHINQF